MDGLPKPLTKPHPPFLIGGGGRRVLGIAAREADIVGINPNLKAGAIGADAAADATAEATDRKVGCVHDAAGAHFDDLVAQLPDVRLHPHRRPVRDRRDDVGAVRHHPREMLEVPHALMGTVDEMCEDLEARRDRWGFSYVVAQHDAIDAFAPVIARMAGN